MPNARERLIEKINTKLMALPYGEITLHTAEEIVDSLIEDGYVTGTNVGKWISVKERKPKHRDWVLVWHTGYGTPKKAFYKDEEWGDFFRIDGHDANPGEITHWMPLPEAPKGE